MYLLDTNVISELRKRKRCDINVAKWFETVESSEQILSVLVLGEIRKGIERLNQSDPVQAKHLESWFQHLQINFKDQILDIDALVSA